MYIGMSVLVSSLLSACGQPGPLYLPKVPAKPGAPADKPVFEPAIVPPPPAMPETPLLPSPQP
ncbi:MAG TPA: hypothetical protein DCW29_24340 [Janthinobacterium sp.]|nr:hypothetical protein [Janthinobacterium sp.]